MSATSNSNGDEETFPCENWATDHDLQRVSVKGVWKCMAHLRVIVMVFMVFTAWRVLSSLSGSMAYTNDHTSLVPCHAVFYQYDQLGRQIDFNVGEQYFGWGKRPNISDIERTQWGVQVSKYFGGETTFDDSATDIAMAYDQGVTCEVDFVSRNSNDTWLLMHRKTSTQVPMDAICGGEEPGLWRVHTADFFVLKMALIVWFVLKLQGMYIEWICLGGLAEAKLWSGCGLHILNKFAMDILHCDWTFNKTRKKWREASHATFFKRIVFLTFTLGPTSLITPILDLKLNSVCAQLVTTSFSNRAQFYTNVACISVIAAMLVLAWAFHELLGERSRTPITERREPDSAFCSVEADGDTSMAQEEGTVAGYAGQVGARACPCIFNRAPEKLIWIKGSTGKGVEMEGFRVHMRKVVLIAGRSNDDSVSEEGDPPSGLYVQEEGKDRLWAKREDLYVAFTYYSIDPKNMLKDVTVRVWRYAIDVITEFYWPLARRVVPKVLAMLHEKIRGGDVGQKVRQFSEENYSEEYPCCSGCLVLFYRLALYAWLCLKFIPLIMLGMVLYAFVCLIAIPVLLIITFLGVVPILPLLVPASMWAYQIRLFMYSYEIPFMFVNFSWALYFWYPQFDLSFNLSMFYMLSLILGFLDILGTWSNSLARRMKTAYKTKREATKKIKEKWGNVKTGYKQFAADDESLQSAGGPQIQM
jgi:hypothetical protein